MNNPSNLLFVLDNRLNRREFYLNSTYKYWLFKTVSLEAIPRFNIGLDEDGVLIRVDDVHSVIKRTRVFPFNKKNRYE